VSKIAKLGTQVIVPYRDEDEKRHLRVMGDLGQIVPMVCWAKSGADGRNGTRGTQIRYMSA
jgi:hypothetical protein